VRRVVAREDAGLAGLPAEQACGCRERQVLHQQTRLLLQPPYDEDALVERQEVVAGHHVGAPIAMGVDLTAQLNRAEARGHQQSLVAIGHHAA